MNLSYWLNVNDNLLLVADNRHAMDDFMELIAKFHYQIGIISDRFPLISSLTTLENIALMYMYHQSFSLAKATAKILPHADKLDMAGSLEKRKESLSREEILKTYVLRCIAKNNIIVLLNTPAVSEIELVLECLETLGKTLRLWVLCLERDAETYGRFHLRTMSIGE